MMSSEQESNMRREPQFFVVRNSRGQYIATYRVLTPAQAIRRHLDDMSALRATFRGAHNIQPDTYTAKVED
jgi:hypothetical protein